MNESSKYNIRYAGFESLADGGRRLHYAITAQGEPARSATIVIPVAAFGGPARVTFQESATIGCEKIRHELESRDELADVISGAESSPTGSSLQLMSLTLSAEDIEQFRPRRRAAGKRS